MVGNFDEVLIWRIIKDSPTELDPCVPTAVRLQIAKFKLHQYQWGAILPNLMFAEVTRYTRLASN